MKINFDIFKHLNKKIKKKTVAQDKQSNEYNNCK